MATFKLNAQFRWPIAYNVTSESWYSFDAGSGFANAFAIAQNMTNQAARTSVFNQIKSAIIAAVQNPQVKIENETWSQITVGLQQFNQWQVNIEGTCSGVNHAIAFASEYLFNRTTSSNIIYGLVLNPTITCDTCQPLTVKACQTSYTLTTGLTPATIYTVALQAVNGNTYTQEVTSDGSGNITIDTTATGFPDGLFTPESGGYILKVYANSSMTTPLTIKVGLMEYTCINLNFTYVTTT